MGYVVALKTSSTHPVDLTAKTSPLITVNIRTHTTQGHMHSTSSYVVNAGAVSAYAVMRHFVAASDVQAVATTQAVSIFPTAVSAATALLSVTSWSGVW